ncbi:hypothetical protein ACS0TY_026548 [Phlomoides rotata]
MTTAGRNNGSSRRIIRMLFSPWYRKRKPKDQDLVEKSEDVAIPLEQLRRFSIDEVCVATRDFSDIIARDVYRGWLADGSQVVVKRYPNNSADINDEFRRELEINSMVAHPNVIHILGFCIAPDELLIVYPLMVNGSVASSLRERHKSQPLQNWKTRERIALGTARGLAHLHEGIRDKKIIHRDIKAANILLDEDFNAVLGDLGLGIIEEHETPYVEVAVHGTVGYIAPEYLSMGRCSEKSDVFSYGVFLLQLISGLSAFDLARLANDKDMTLLEWVERIYTENKWELIVDANCAKSDYMEVLVKLLVQISLLCTRYNSENRPKMSEVVRMMEHEDGLAEGWGELLKDKKKKEKDPWKKDPWIIDDDTFDTATEELSGPR